MDKDNRDDRESTKIIVDGLVHTLTSAEIRDAVPLLIGYALNKSKLSLQDSIEFAFMTISLHNHSFQERNAICDKIIEDARKWKEDNGHADIFIESAKLTIQKLQNTPHDQVCSSKIYLMCVIWLMQVQSEIKESDENTLLFTLKNNIKLDFSERVIPTIHTWYNSMRKVETTSEEYCQITLYYIEYFCNKVSSQTEHFNFVNFLKSYESVTSQEDKVKLVSGLFSTLIENRLSSNEQLFYISLVGDALSVNREKVKEISKKVLSVYKA